INMSKRTRLEQMEDEIDKIALSIEEMSLMTGKKNDWSIKKLEMLKKNLEVKYEKLYKEETKDNHINFEELGVDSLVIDESHRYKNNFIYTKMQRVAGINTSSSDRAMDLHLKAQYISNLNNGKGVIYLTGTPITNSMSELYVLQNTLQPKDLEKKGINTFDKWVSTFGVVEESDEIKPEGTGYQKKMRLSKFHNLPELMKMFNDIADVKTAETLNLPRPTLKTGKEQIIKAELTEEQKQFIDFTVVRAERIRRGTVKPEEDNFLKITLEAKLLSIDPRILDSSIPYNPNTKLNLCARKVAKIYHETADKKSTQLIFCDSGIPKENEFNFYDALKLELMENGVSKEEIAYIHSAKTDEQKEKLFEKVRNGEIRVLIGSTEKMGVGTNVQDKLYALHNLDVPWRPDQLIQRNGRILRQGNENKEVEIFNYIREGSFDSYLYQILEN
ncbi:MAG: helicase, partial [Eubacteriales bacterium]|nr:helicase [Eubacteriales bacterium]